MSLRTDIHGAFEAIEPPLGGLAERVVDAAKARARTHERRRRFMFGLRTPLPLVAALVVLAIVVAVLVGGTVWWTTTRTSPARSGGLPTLAELEARPWAAQLLAKGNADCSAAKEGPLNFLDPSVYFNGAAAGYFSAQVVTNRGVEGLVLIRARNARTGVRSFFVNDNAAGAIVGTDIVETLTVERRAELVLDIPHSAARPNSIGQITWNFTMGPYPNDKGVPQPSNVSTCLQVQADGTLNGKPFVQYFMSI